MSWDRVVLLYEDRAHGDFLRSLCRAQGLKVVAEHAAPKGRGAASDWVIRQLPERLIELRTGEYAGLGLLVAVDGDNRGRAARLTMMNYACASCGQDGLDGRDPVAVLVPTWSIDTWALFFCKDIVIPEHEPSKSRGRKLFRPPHRAWRAPGVPVEDAPRIWKTTHLAALTRGFLSDRSDPRLPSLEASREDLRRCAS